MNVNQNEQTDASTRLKSHSRESRSNTFSAMVFRGKRNLRNKSITQNVVGKQSEIKMAYEMYVLLWRECIRLFFCFSVQFARVFSCCMVNKFVITYIDLLVALWLLTSRHSSICSVISFPKENSKESSEFHFISSSYPYIDICIRKYMSFNTLKQKYKRKNRRMIICGLRIFMFARTYTLYLHFSFCRIYPFYASHDAHTQKLHLQNFTIYVLYSHSGRIRKKGAASLLSIQSLFFFSCVVEL